MKRGDIVTVAASGDYGKPRPAVVVQTDAMAASHGSVVLCQMTSDLNEGLEFRPVIDPTGSNGLRLRSQVMADKPVTVRRERVGRVIGRLGSDDLDRLAIALTFVLGLGQ